MVLVACGLLALGVLVFMISPMLERSGRRRWLALSRRDDLLKKKDFVYSAIRELDIDYNMGKLLAEDHEVLRQEYIEEASVVLEELDRNTNVELPVADQIEQAVLDIRMSQVSLAEPSEETIVRTEKLATCASCETVNEESSNFCIECGVSLKRNTCRECGTENTDEANFCAQCGKKLT